MLLSTKRIDFFLIGLLVICLPFLFHLNIIIELNVSLADILMIVILFWLISHQENRDILSVVIIKYNLVIIYISLLIYFCILSMASYYTNIYLDFPYGVFAIVKLSINSIYIIVFLVYIEKYKEEIILLILRCWKFIAVIISILCISSVILYGLGIDNGLTSGGRAQATLNDPNLAALYLIVSLSVIALTSIYMQKKFIINPSMAIVFIALLLTASRGGILSIGIGILIVVFLSVMSGKIKELFLFLVVACILTFIILWINNSSDVLSFTMERVSSIGTEGDGTSDRLFLWESAIEMWAHNPLIGVGIGQFIPYSTEMFGFTFSSIPHNTYLSFLSETGVLGFISFIWFPVYLVINFMIRLVSQGDKINFYVLIGLLAVAIQAISINIENIRFIWIFIALAYCLSKYEPIRE